MENDSARKQQQQQIADTHTQRGWISNDFPKWEKPDLKGYRTYDPIYMIY